MEAKKAEKLLKQIARLPENKRCFNCESAVSARGPWAAPAACPAQIPN
jgi:hypothetical protein